MAQRHDGAGEVFVYTRIWQKTCSGCEGFGRGIAMSSDGGVSSHFPPSEGEAKGI